MAYVMRAKTVWAGAAIAALFAAATQPCSAAAQPVDLELVIATDVSRSINEEEAYLQRQGVAAAFSSPEVIRAIQLGALGRIGVAYIDWSMDYLNKVIVDWTVIKDKAGAEAFTNALLSAPISIGQRTSISSALQLSSQMIETNALQGTRRVIDISGDGPNNSGLALAPIREEVIAKGITINGLPIIVDNAVYAGGGFFADIDKYYAACVIGGRGAFLIVARGFQDFATAVRHKLVLEISDLKLEPAPKVIKAHARPGARLQLAQAQSPTLRNGPVIVRPPAVRETNCDRPGGGFGGGGFGTFGR
jgi:hypothetical protein